MTVFYGEDLQLRCYWKIARVIALFAALSALLALLGSITGLPWISNGAVHAGAILAVLVSLLLERRSPSFVGLVIRRGWEKDLLAGIVWGAISVVAVVFSMVGITSEIRLDAFFAGFRLDALVKGLLFYGFVALGEEILFRGYVISALHRRLGATLSIGIAAVIFSLIHVINPDYYWFAFVYAFFMAVLLGFVFVRRGTLWTVLGFHFAWDFLQSDIVFNVPSRGGELIFAIVIVANFAIARYLLSRSTDPVAGEMK